MVQIILTYVRETPLLTKTRKENNKVVGPTTLSSFLWMRVQSRGNSLLAVKQTDGEIAKNIRK
jgi:hypothetical protein